MVLGEADVVDPGFNPAFEGELETPSQRLMVSTVAFEPVVTMDVSTTRTHVRVWVNHPEWPDKVIVGWG